MLNFIKGISAEIQSHLTSDDFPHRSPPRPSPASVTYAEGLNLPIISGAAAVAARRPHMADDASSVLSDKPSNLGDSSDEVCTFFLGNIVFCLLYSAGCKTKPLIYLFICCLNNLLCILQFINCIFQQLKASWYYFCFYYVVNILKKK